MLSDKQIIDYINSEDNKHRIETDWMRYKVYNGQLKNEIKLAIKKEFKKPETIDALLSRIIPINITQKITNKLAGVYRNPALRQPADGNEKDEQAISTIEQATTIDLKMRLSNRYFKLIKQNLLEWYLDGQGKPSLRSLPSHTYSLMSDDTIEPNNPTHFIKHMVTGQTNKEDDLYHVWTDDQFFWLNGRGIRVTNPDNVEGVNPYKTSPFVYINESPDMLMPLQDDDLIAVQIAICILLTDLAFATKYQSWSIVYLIGALAEEMQVNPSSIISLPINPDGTKPEIGTLKMSVDTEGTLRQVEALVGLLLTTKSLSIGSVSTQLSVQSAASGVSKMLDEAQTTEDKVDQEEYFRQAEKSLWNKLAFNIMPTWRKLGELDPTHAVDFTNAFDLNISFPQVKPIVGDKETIENEKLKVEAGFTSKRRAIAAVHPQLEDAQLDLIEAEIVKESQQDMATLEIQDTPVDNGAET